MSILGTGAVSAFNHATATQILTSNSTDTQNRSASFERPLKRIRVHISLITMSAYDKIIEEKSNRVFCGHSDSVRLDW